MINNSEHNEQCAVIHWCELNKNKYHDLEMIFAIPNGGHRHISVAKKLKAEGVKPGVPDLFLPVAKNNKHGLFIEMKSYTGKVSKSQTKMISKLYGYQYEVKICHSFYEAVKEICDYLKIPFKL